MRRAAWRLAAKPPNLTFIPVHHCARSRPPGPSSSPGAFAGSDMICFPSKQQTAPRHLPHGHWRKVVLTVHALAELVFKDFWEPAALSWPPVGTHAVQLEKSTESGAQGWGWGCVSLSLCSPGLSAWGHWAVLFYHLCDKGHLPAHQVP